MEFFSKLYASRAGALFHFVLLDSLHDAFQRGVNNFCSSIASGLVADGYEMSNDPGVASVLDVSAIMKLLPPDLQICMVSMTVACTVLDLLLQLGWLIALITIGFSLIANVGAVVNFCFW